MKWTVAAQTEREAMEKENPVGLAWIVRRAEAITRQDYMRSWSSYGVSQVSLLQWWEACSEWDWVGKWIQERQAV